MRLGSVIAMALHVHAAWLPQVAYTAGAILPYPAHAGPTNVAQATIMAYRNLLMPNFSPAIRQEPSPETIGRWAKRLADAMAAGMKPPPYADRRLVEAAKMINQGKAIVIKSAGRSAIVNARGSGPTTAASADPADPGRKLSWSR